MLPLFSELRPLYYASNMPFCPKPRRIDCQNADVAPGLGARMIAKMQLQAPSRSVQSQGLIYFQQLAIMSSLVGAKLEVMSVVFCKKLAELLAKLKIFVDAKLA